MSQRRRWSRTELLVALNIYQKLPFGQFNSRNPVITQVAEKLKRTPSSVAMKLCNLASLDPVLRMRGIRGLSGASQLDVDIWSEFHSNLEQSVNASEIALRDVFGVHPEERFEVVPNEGFKRLSGQPPEVTTRPANIEQRRGQEYFRDVVLNNFNGRCGVTQLPVRELLVASHILPWASYPNERLNPRNGLCLNRLHDAAFDRGLITFDSQMRLMVSPLLKSHAADEAVKQNFANLEGIPLSLPHDALQPDQNFLRVHRRKIFQRR